MKNIKLLTTLSVIIFSLSLTLTGCQKPVDNNSEKQSESKVTKIDCGFNITVPDGAPLISAGLLQSKNSDCVKVNLVSNLDQLMASIEKNESDFYIVGVNVAAKLYLNSNRFEVVGIATHNLNYLFAAPEFAKMDRSMVAKENKLKSLTENNSVLAFAKAGIPGVSLRNDFSNAKVNPKTEYLTDSSEVVASLLKGKANFAGAEQSIDFAELAEPAASAVELNPQLKDKYIRLFEVGKNNDPQAVLVVNKEKAANYDLAKLAALYEKTTDVKQEDAEQTIEETFSYVSQNFESAALKNKEAVKNSLLKLYLRVNFEPANNSDVKENIISYLNELGDGGIDQTKIEDSKVDAFFAKF